MKKCLLIDDHKVILDGLQHLLEERGYEVLGRAETCEKAYSLLKNFAPNCEFVILDLQLPDGSGMEINQFINKNFPQIKCLALTMVNDPAVVLEFLQTGGNGYVSKADDFNRILEAIQLMEKDETYISQNLKDIVLNKLTHQKVKNTYFHRDMLTRREKQVLSLIRDEKTVPEIAKDLNIAESTVITHRKSLLMKLNARNTAGLIRAIYEYDLLP